MRSLLTSIRWWSGSRFFSSSRELSSACPRMSAYLSPLVTPGKCWKDGQKKLKHKHKPVNVKVKV